MSVYVHRRGSIFWALILIAVGALFLYQNFNPSVRPWQIIAKYWPILIIFWGLSKLVDYFHARWHPEIATPPLFSGSEVVLLILVLLLGTLMSKIVLRQWPEVFIHDEELRRLFLSSYTYTETIARPVQPPARLIFVNRRGDVEIRTSEQPRIEGVIKKTVWALDEESAKQLSAQLKLEIVEQGSAWLLQANTDALPQGARNIRLDVTLHVPKTTSTEITAERGDVILDGLRGDQKITARRGDLHVANVEGLVRVQKSGALAEIRDVKGNVELEGRGEDVSVANVSGAVVVNGDFSGSVQFRNIGQTLRFSSSRTELTAQKLGGRLDLEMGSLEVNDIDGPLEVTTRQKDIRVENFKHSVKVRNRNGDVHLRSVSVLIQPIDVDVEKGGIELYLPSNTNFQIDATSHRGEAQCDFSGPNLKVVQEPEKPSITGTYGRGGPMIRLRTTYGTIRVGRLGPPPPAPPVPPAPVVGEKETQTSQAGASPSSDVGLAQAWQPAVSLAQPVGASCMLDERALEKLSQIGLRLGHACARLAKALL